MGGEDGRMGGWEDGRMGGWEDGRVRRREGGGDEEGKTRESGTYRVITPFINTSLRKERASVGKDTMLDFRLARPFFPISIRQSLALSSLS